MSWYLQAIKNYCNFSGRARRREYWMFVLISAVIAFVLGIIDEIVGIKLFTSLYSLFILIPELSLTFRRLHDIDKSAWWLFIAFVPIVGAIILFVFSVKPGTVGTNRYGDDPRDTYIR